MYATVNTNNKTTNSVSGVAGLFLMHGCVEKGVDRSPFIAMNFITTNRVFVQDGRGT